MYPIPGATERIAQLRRRYLQLSANVAHYEAKVSQQVKDLEQMNLSSSRGGYEEDDPDEEPDDNLLATKNPIPITKEDLEREDVEIRELER